MKRDGPTSASLGLKRLVGRVPSAWAIALVTIDLSGVQAVSRPIVAPGFGQTKHLSLAADPFFTTWENEVFVFFEAVTLDDPRGQIHLAVLDLDGECTYRGPALETDVHTSFPFVMHDAQSGMFFMLPETSAANEVRLYSANSPNGPWSMVDVLVNGRPFVDSVLCHVGNGWLLVTESSGGTHDRREIFAADSLTGPFEPVGSWVRSPSCTRMAGRVMQRSNQGVGELRLLNQNCEENYGKSVGIERLTIAAKPVDQLRAKDIAFGVSSTILEANPDDWYHVKVHSADLRSDSDGMFGVMDGRGRLRNGRKAGSDEVSSFVQRALGAKKGEGQ